MRLSAQEGPCRVSEAAGNMAYGSMSNGMAGELKADQATTDL